MMAFERLEPFGSLHDEFMHGQQSALLANINRDPKRSQAFGPHDFMPALRVALGKPEYGAPVLLEDAEAQSQLIIASLFGPKLGPQDG